MIKINSLIKRFDEVTAVNNLTIDIDVGVTGLVGHNGAGKSTLFRLMSGVYKYDSGSITIDGIDAISPEGKSKIFFLSDNPYSPSHVDVNGLLDFYQSYFDIDKEKYLDLITKFELPRNRRVINFSKGMKRQAFICIALASRCPILLLDEAFDGLDPLVLEKIKDEIISAAEENKTIVISSHNIATLERLCDRFIILHKGKLGKSAETTDLGNSFIKYQILFKRPVTEDMLRAYGANIVTFKMVGSLCNIVTNGELDEEFIKSKLETVLLEQIPIDSTEIVALEMLMVKKNEGGNRHVE